MFFYGNRDNSRSFVNSQCLQWSWGRVYFTALFTRCQGRSEIDGNPSMVHPRWQLSGSSQEVRNRLLAIGKEGIPSLVGSRVTPVGSNL